MKRKVEKRCKVERKEGLVKKWKKLGNDALSLSKKLSWDEFRRKQGIIALRNMDMEEETVEQEKNEKEKIRDRCKEIGEIVCNMLTVRNMTVDWMETGWLHWKKMLSDSFIEELFAEEVEELMRTAVEEDEATFKRKKALYRLHETKLLEEQSKALPIHEMVIVKMMETLTAGVGILRVTMYETKDNVPEDSEQAITQEGLTQKKMRELHSGQNGWQKEPLCLLIPLTTALCMKTQEQYRKHLGRPRRGKEHRIEVGDVFLMSWRLLHSFTCDSKSSNGKKPKWIVISAARNENHLMY